MAVECVLGPRVSFRVAGSFVSRMCWHPVSPPFLPQVIAIRPTRRVMPLPGTLEDEEEEEDNDDIVMLEKKIRASHMPEQAHRVCVKEIRR